jgi:adenylate cyclase
MSLALGLSVGLTVSIFAALVAFIALVIAIFVVTWRRRVMKRAKVFAYAPKEGCGCCAVVFSDIQESTTQWNKDPKRFKQALAVHNDVMRRVMAKCMGYEVKTVGDAFMCAFADPLQAVKFMLWVQLELLRADWAPQLLENRDSRRECDSRGRVIFNGLRVRIGGAWGKPGMTR